MKVFKLLCVLLAFMALSSFAFKAMATRFEPAVIDKAEPCCKACLCTRSLPPQCRCNDVKHYCEPSCKACYCTRSIPPQCHCADILDHCEPPQCLEQSFDPWRY